jgi:hypothetical protein
MPEILGVIQTSWPKIRVVLHRRDDGFFQFFEQHLTCDDKDHAYSWQDIHASGLYDRANVAQEALTQYAEEIENTWDSESLEPQQPHLTG